LTGRFVDEAEMNTKIVAAAVAIGVGAAPALHSPPPSGLTGEWVSVVTEATPFPLVMHVHREVRLDSPDRGVFGVPGDLRQSGRHVGIVFANGAAFEGDLQGDRLAGDYLRGPAALPLAFQRKRSWLGRLAG
jgi:hypothetical protein